jgi:hypothetical protein
MEVLVHKNYRDVEIKIVRIEYSKVTTIDKEADTVMVKKADRAEGATYETKHVQSGDVSFGISITRSK